MSDLFNQPKIYTHYVEYEKYSEIVSYELNGARTEIKRVTRWDENQKRWVKSLVMEEKEIESFIRFFVTGCRSSSGQYRIIKLEKPTTNHFYKIQNEQ